MSLIKWEQFDGLDQLFDERFSPSLPRITWDLAADIYEENGNIVVKMNLPGLNPEQVDVSVEDDNLFVSGGHNEKKETKKKDYYSKEIRRGAFSRVILLPKFVEANKANAKLEKGLLTVTLPVVAGKKRNPSKIKVTK